MSCAATGAALAVTPGASPPPAFRDPLDTPATPDVRATHEPLLAVAMAGHRIVAAGLRGLIIGSDDGGAHWTQANVPVQADLVSLTFLDDLHGWATGQLGAILSTADGGRNWIVRFDGRRNTGFTAEYQRRVAAGDASAAPFAKLMVLNTQEGSILPYLGAAFPTPKDGYVVGSYGMLIATHDGGDTWEPWLDRIDNPQSFNLNAAAVIAGRVWIAGEGGQVYVLDPAADRFVRHDTGYAGTLFGITGDAHALVAYGLLGNAFRSTDGGVTWQKVETGSGTTIANGAMLPDGRVVLCTENGQLLVGSAATGALRPVASAGGFPYAGLAVIPGDRLAMVGLGGVVLAPVP